MNTEKTIEVPRDVGVLDQGQEETFVADPPAPMPKGKYLDEKAYNNGWNARLRESPLWANPHTVNKGLHFIWYVGWQDCNDHFKARRRAARQQAV